ncbi:MAG: Wzz/FepE/Etk N-terminal domain-containing protein [Clostridiales bacterium]
MNMLFYLRILKKRLYLFVAGMIIVAILSCYYNAFVLKSVYKSYSTLYIWVKENDKEELSMMGLNIASAIITDYKEIIKSRHIYNGVVNELKDYDNIKDITYDEFYEKVFVQLLPNTRILKLSVEDEDPEFCKTVAEITTKYFLKEINTITNLDSVSIIDEPILSDIPIGPDKRKNVVVSMAAAFVFITGIAISIELLDKKIRSQEYLELVSKVKVIGTIPKVVVKKKNVKVLVEKDNTKKKGETSKGIA